MQHPTGPNAVLRGLAIGCMALAVLPATSLSVVVDFESFYAMDYLSGYPIPEAARLSDQLAATDGVIFSSGAPYVAVVHCEPNCAPSGTHMIGGSTPEGILTYEGEWPVVFTFVNPQHPETPAVTDYVSVRGDLWADSGMDIVLNAYNVNGVLVDSDQAFDAPGVTLTVTAPGIHRVEFLGTHDWCGVALDDLTFNPVGGPTPTASQTWGKLKALYR
jgi:hypothetical protein